MLIISVVNYGLANAVRYDKCDSVDMVELFYEALESSAACLMR